MCLDLAQIALACVTSVSVGLSAGLKHFSCFEHAKIGASAKKLPLPVPSISVVFAPIFTPPKSENASNGRKNLRKRLLHRLKLLKCTHVQRSCNRLLKKLFSIIL